MYVQVPSCVYATYFNMVFFFGWVIKLPGWVISHLLLTMLTRGWVKILKILEHWWCQLKGLVTRTIHAKDQCSIIYNSEDNTQVKDFVTDRRREGRMDEWVLILFMSPAFATVQGVIKTSSTPSERSVKMHAVNITVQGHVTILSTNSKEE